MAALPRETPVSSMDCYWMLLLRYCMRAGMQVTELGATSSLLMAASRDSAATHMLHFSLERIRAKLHTSPP